MPQSMCQELDPAQTRAPPDKIDYQWLSEPLTSIPDTVRV